MCRHHMAVLEAVHARFTNAGCFVAVINSKLARELHNVRLAADADS